MSKNLSHQKLTVDTLRLQEFLSYRGLDNSIKSSKTSSQSLDLVQVVRSEVSKIIFNVQKAFNVLELPNLNDLTYVLPELDMNCSHEKPMHSSVIDRIGVPPWVKVPRVVQKHHYTAILTHDNLYSRFVCNFCPHHYRPSLQHFFCTCSTTDG